MNTSNAGSVIVSVLTSTAEEHGVRPGRVKLKTGNLVFGGLSASVHQ
jgi:hypothetical protein